jgi:hypothetical protein
VVLGTAHRLGLDPIVFVSSELALLPPAEGTVLTPDSPGRAAFLALGAIAKAANFHAAHRSWKPSGTRRTFLITNACN